MPSVSGLWQCVTIALFDRCFYRMFGNDKLRRGGGVIMYISESIQACEIQLKSVVNFNEIFTDSSKKHVSSKKIRVKNRMCVQMDK